MKHYITKYEEGGKWYAEAWDQINVFGKSYCFNKRRIEIPTRTGALEAGLQKLEDVFKEMGETLVNIGESWMREHE